MKFAYPDLLTCTYDNKRWYNTPIGWLPSITSLLAHTQTEEKKASLNKWRESVGAKEADRICKQGTDRGTIVHILCERFLKGQLVEAPIDGQLVELADLQTFNALKLKLGGISEIWGQEVALYSHTLQVAGRCDLIAVYKGRPVIIDFKTSRRIKSVDDIHDYKVQLCFYGIAHNEMFGTNISEGVILMVAEAGFPMEFTIRLADYLPDLQKRAITMWHDAINNA